LERKITADITVLKRQMDDLAFDKMAFVALKAGYDRKREELNELKLKLLERRNEFENVCREIEHVLADISEQKRLLADKAKEETEVMYLSLLERIMNDFKVYMVGMIRPMLSDYASDMLRRLTDGKYSKLELDENYDVFIYDEGTSYEINRFSGGEEDLANLCLRLAISAVVSERSAIQTNFIILDEIFGSQDALRKRNIITALNELSKKFRQIFLITHIEEVKDYMEYVLRVTEDEEGVSWVGMGE
jgi:exonuclease SbcC